MCIASSLRGIELLLERCFIFGQLHEPLLELLVFLLFSLKLLLEIDRLDTCSGSLFLVVNHCFK